ncbi:hypothetical protein C0580_03735 [Candidatus Parcubacteria bacterium]|nr:MAG: hypothetical protein C0580_03735 [Candidatus Parcubacteria bacterium]
MDIIKFIIILFIVLVAFYFFVIQKKVKKSGKLLYRETNVSLLLLFFIFLLAALANVLFAGTEYASLLFKINPFVFGFIFYGILNFAFFKKGSQLGDIIFSAIVIGITFILDSLELQPQFFEKFSSIYSILGIVLATVASVLSKYFIKDYNSTSVLNPNNLSFGMIVKTIIKGRNKL